MEEYERGGLSQRLHGDFYQIKLLMLFIKRGLDRGESFRLATEWKQAGKFDDLIYQRIENNQQIYRFLQAKHKSDETKRISSTDLLTDKNDDFSLQKYFQSFLDIKQNRYFIGPNINLNDFIICTNIDIENDVEEFFELVNNKGDILKSEKLNNKNPRLLKFKHENLIKEQLIKKFQDISDFNKLVDRLAFHTTSDNLDPKNLFHDCSLFKKYYGALRSYIIDFKTYKFQTKFLCCAELPEDVKKLRDRLLNKLQINDEDFHRKLENKKIEIFSKLGNIFYLIDRPEIAKDEIDKLVSKIVSGINKSGTSKIVDVDVNIPVIGSNIKHLAGHVFVKVENVVKFRKGFLDGEVLPGNLYFFREGLKNKLVQNLSHVEFKQLDQFEFKISFRTCSELDYTEYQIDKSYFKNLPKEITIDEIDYFLDRFILAVDQPNVTEIEAIIKNELADSLNEVDTENVYGRLLKFTEDWVNERIGRFISHENARAFFDKINKEILGDIKFNMRDPIESFTGREDELKKIHEALQEGCDDTKSRPLAYSAAVCGLGGIGKSELVRKYAYIYGKEYYDGNLIWINAQTLNSLEKSFVNLAKDKRLGILKEEARNQTNIESIVSDVYRRFEKKKCLFIFDNAEMLRSRKRQYSSPDKQDDKIGAGIDKFLPQSSSSCVHTPRVLITSRNKKWGNSITLIPLGSLTEEEASEFIKNTLYIKDESQDIEIKHLVDKLQCFPLALQQAVAYIKERNVVLQNIGSQFKIRDYLDRFDEKTKQLLNFEFPEDSQDFYTRTTFKTWKITTDNINKNSELGGIANEILDIIAYFPPDGISVKMFLELEALDKDAELLGETVQLLKQYSMINSAKDQTVFNVHRLVQQVTRINLKDHGKEKETLRKALKLIQQNLESNNTDTHNEAVSAWKYAMEYEELEDEFDKLPLKLIELKLSPEILEHNDPEAANVWIINSFDEAYKKQEKRKSYVENVENILEKLDPNHLIVADAKYELSYVYGKLENHQKRIELRKEIMDVLENHYGSNHIKCVDGKINLAIAYTYIDENEKSKQLKEEAVAILENHYGSDHIKVTEGKIKLAIAYNNLGEFEKAKTLYEDALIVLKNYYGANHVKVAECKMKLAIAYRWMEHHHKEKQLKEEAMIVLERHYGSDNLKVAEGKIKLAVAYNILGDYENARKLYEVALRILEKHYGKGHMKTADAKLKLAFAHKWLKNHEKERALNEEAVEILVNHYGSNNIHVANAKIRLAATYKTLEEYKKAKMLYKEALDVLDDYYGPGHIQVVFAQVTLAYAYGSLQRQETGRTILENASSSLEKRYGRDKKSIESKFKIADAYGFLGDFDKGKYLFLEALEELEKHYSPNHIKVAQAITSLPYAFIFLNEDQRTINIIENAFSILDAHFGSNHFKVAEAQSSLAFAYEESKNYQKEKELIEAALPILEKRYGHLGLVAQVKVNLANALWHVGHHQRHNEILEEIIPVLEKEYGPNHFKVIEAKNSLSRISENIN